MTPSRLQIALAIFISTSLFSLTAAADEYAFILKGRGNVFWKVIKQGVEEASKAQNIQATVYNTDDDQTPEAQLNICLAAIQRKPKVIVLGAVTKPIGIACFKKAAEAGIAIADIDGNVTIADGEEAGLKLAFSVGSDNVDIGRLAAAEMVKQLHGQDPSILVLKGLPGSIVSENRTEGFLSRLKELAPHVKVVAALSADWDRMKSMNLTLDILQRSSNLDGIYSVSDVMSLGVVEGLKVAHREGKVALVSVDGIADGRKALLDGRMSAIVAQLPYLMGYRSVELALKAASGEVNGVTEYIPTPILTKEVLEANAEPNLKYVR